MSPEGKKEIRVSQASDVSVARRTARQMATEIGFPCKTGEEIALVTGELAANLVKHAGGGVLTLAPLEDCNGVQIESADWGPGIADVDEAMVDGFSTAGGLGYGLGSVNRMMDELDIRSSSQGAEGTCIACKRWLRREAPPNPICPLAFGAASRPHPRMAVNGDAFVVARQGESALVGVIDGLGHGQFAHQAAQRAREYILSHAARPLDDIFRGVGYTCRATRGVVMALARFDWGMGKVSFASIGNIEVRVFGRFEPLQFAARRGVVGGRAPKPVVSEDRWDPRQVMVLHSDGLTTHWQWVDFPQLAEAPPDIVAQELLRALATDNDDATVLVVRGHVS